MNKNKIGYYVLNEALEAVAATRRQLHNDGEDYEKIDKLIAEKAPLIFEKFETMSPLKFKIYCKLKGAGVI